MPIHDDTSLCQCFLIACLESNWRAESYDTTSPSDAKQLEGAHVSLVLPLHFHP